MEFALRVYLDIALRVARCFNAWSATGSKDRFGPDRIGSARLSDKQMHVLRQRKIAGSDKTVPPRHCLKFPLEDAVRRRRAQQRLTTIPTKRHKVITVALLVTD